MLSPETPRTPMTPTSPGSPGDNWMKQQNSLTNCAMIYTIGGLVT